MHKGVGKIDGTRVMAPIRDFKIQYHDGETWQDVLPPIIGNDKPAWAATFTPVTTRKLRLVVTVIPLEV